MFLNDLIQEYVEEALYMRKHIKKVKQEIFQKLKDKDPESCYRIFMLYDMYKNLKSIAIFLATGREECLK